MPGSRSRKDGFRKITCDPGRNGLSRRFMSRSLLGLIAFIFFFSLSSAVSADEIKSRAAVVMDALTGRVLYAKNPDLRLLPASTTKLMTALVVLERANLGDVVTVSKKAAGVSPIRVGLKAGDKVTVENLLYAALMKSGNDAAVALAEAIAGSEEEFVAMMNKKAAAIGAIDTRYTNATGLPGDGQYITAYDLSMIMRQAIKYPVLREILGTRITEVSTETGKQIVIQNTNKLLWSDDEVLGGKTGYTRKARHCFVCAGERANDTIIVALLGTPYRGLLWKETEDLMAFGAKVLGKTEEPVLYLTQSDRAIFQQTKVSYNPGSSPLDGKAKVKKSRVKKTGVSAHKSGTKRGKKAEHVKVKTKSRKARKHMTAQRGEDGVQG